MGRHQSIAWEAWINLFWKTWVQQISPKWFVEVLFYLADNLASWVLWIKCVWCKSQLIWLPVDQDKRSEVAHAVLSLRTNFGNIHVPSRSDLTTRLFSFPFLVSSLFPTHPSCKLALCGCTNGPHTSRQLWSEKWPPSAAQLQRGKRKSGALSLYMSSHASSASSLFMELIEEKECYFLLVSTWGERRCILIFTAAAGIYHFPIKAPTSRSSRGRRDTSPAAYQLTSW